ncbi:MAG: hypothetical protein Q9220_001594 [cf. Caloplaca sp. 1 TL-2023]
MNSPIYEALVPPPFRVALHPLTTLSSNQKNTIQKMLAASTSTCSPCAVGLGGETPTCSSHRPQQEAQSQPDGKDQRPVSPPASERERKGPTQKRPKIRLSCDSCAAAKVRCSKEHPRCERCIDSNFQCVYGLSMKHGKGLQKRRNRESQTTPARRQSPLLSTEQAYDNDLQQSFSDLLENIDSTTNLPPSHFWHPGSSDIEMKDPLLTTAPTSDTTATLDDSFWTDAMLNSNCGLNDIGNMSPEAYDMTQASLTPLEEAMSSMSNTELPQFMSEFPLSPISGRASPNDSPKGLPFQQTQVHKQGTGKHDCYVVANSTLAILHVSPRPISHDNHSDSTCSSASSSASYMPSQVVQHLDEILRCTREAMGNLPALLKCSCASDPQMAMLGASIINRILFWHQVAAGVQTSIPMPSTGWNIPPIVDSIATPTSANPSRRSSCSTSSAFIASEPVKIGSYIPDQEDQEPMRRLFLLISLKKLGRLIEAFSQVEDRDPGSTELRKVLVAWMNSELSQAIKVVGKGAKAAVGQQF